jgi:hypothetical protein
MKAGAFTEPVLCSDEKPWCSREMQAPMKLFTPAFWTILILARWPSRDRVRKVASWDWIPKLGPEKSHFPRPNFLSQWQYQVIWTLRCSLSKLWMNRSRRFSSPLSFESSEFSIIMVFRWDLAEFLCLTSVKIFVQNYNYYSRLPAITWSIWLTAK